MENMTPMAMSNSDKLHVEPTPMGWTAYYDPEGLHGDGADRAGALEDLLEQTDEAWRKALDEHDATKRALSDEQNFANGSGGFTINDKGRAALPELNGVGNADPLYVIAGGSDGYFAKIVSGSELDDAYLAALFGTAEGAGDQRVDLLRQLRDPDGWTCGGQSFMERFEDGWLYIFRLTEPPAVPSQVNSAMELDYKEWASILASILKATRPHVAASTLPGSNVPTLLSNLDGILESYGQDGRLRIIRHRPRCPDRARR
jgi:hypothetical protein